MTSDGKAQINFWPAQYFNVLIFKNQDECKISNIFKKISVMILMPKTRMRQAR